MFQRLHTGLLCSHTHAGSPVTLYTHQDPRVPARPLAPCAERLRGSLLPGPSERPTSLHLAVHTLPDGLTCPRKAGAAWLGPRFPTERAASEHRSNTGAVQGHGWWPHGP